MKEFQRKCFKCGRSRKNDPTMLLFRFPKPGTRNLLRCESWARFCLPEKQWMSAEFQYKLFSRHLMLCDRHFKSSQFADSNRTRLLRSAEPTEEGVDDGNNVDLLGMSTDLLGVTTDRLATTDANILQAKARAILDLKRPDVAKPSVLQDVTDTVEHQPDEDVESPCPSPEVDEKVDEKPQDLPVTCHECHLLVEGHRFVCVSCSGCVVCVSCVTLGVHPTCYVLRVPPHRPLWEVKAVLQAVRSALAMSAFADQLAEPLAGYSIVDVKSEPGDYLDLQREDEIMEADSVPTVAADPLAENKPSNKTSSILSVEPVPSGARSAQTTGAHESLTRDVKSSAESRTDGISHPDPLGTESEAGASQINTDLSKKRVIRLRKIVPSKFCRVKDKAFSEPKTDKEEDTREKSVSPPTIRIGRDKLKVYKVKPADHIRRLELSADAKGELLVKQEVLPNTKNTSGGPDKGVFKIPNVLLKARPLPSNVASAETQATKRILVTNEASHRMSLRSINLPTSSAKESAALGVIPLGTSDEISRITLRKRPLEESISSVTLTPKSLFNFEEKDSSDEKTVRRVLMYNYVRKLPKVKLVKKVDTINI